MQGRVGVLLRGLVLSSLFYLVVMGSVVFVDELQAPFAAAMKSPIAFLPVGCLGGAPVMSSSPPGALPRPV